MTMRFENFIRFADDFRETRKNNKKQVFQIALFLLSAMINLYGLSHTNDFNMFTVVGILGLAVFLIWLIHDVRAFARRKGR